MAELPMRPTGRWRRNAVPVLLAAVAVLLIGALLYAAAAPTSALVGHLLSPSVPAWPAVAAAPRRNGTILAEFLRDRQANERRQQHRLAALRNGGGGGGDDDDGVSAAAHVAGGETPQPKRLNRFLMFTGFPGGFRPDSKTRKFSTYAAASVLTYSAMHADTDALVVDSRRFTSPKGIHYWRIPAIEEFLPRYEWLMWVDADTVITNFSIALSEFVDDDHKVTPETFLIIRKVVIPGISKDINNGVFMIRNTPLAFKLLRVWGTMPMVKPKKPTYYDQSDLIVLLNDRKRLNPDERASPYNGTFLSRTRVQERHGLVLQHYSGLCKDCCERWDERAMFHHWPGDCATKGSDPARTTFCKAFRLEDVTRADLQRNTRQGGVSREELAAVAWAVDQCANREELDELWRAVRGGG
jgi:hypothetical protein